MSTNFYLVDKCTHCGRSDSIHLGKRSVGWKFLLRANKGTRLTSFSKILEMISNKHHEGYHIEDEYHRLVLRSEFISIVNELQENKSRINDLDSHNPSTVFEDDEGYELLDAEFS